MRRLLLALLLTITVLWAAPLAADDFTCSEALGRTERQSYRSVIAQTTMHYTVYLPPCYESAPTESYPTLYLLHGSAQYDDHWLQIDLDDALNEGIASGVYPPMIAVLPYGEWIANQNDFGRVTFERVFLEELLPAVEGRYRVATTREQRAIGGISRGGFWAFEIAFRHPEQFAAVGGHSAFFDPFHAPPTHNPLNLALDAPNIDTLAIWLDRGADDYAYDGLDRMGANLSARGVPHTYTIHPTGEHDNRYWRAHVRDYLAFYAQSLQAAQMPSVLTAPTPPDPSLFTFSPPRALPDPQAFVFSPPKSASAPPTPSYEVFVAVVGFNSTQTTLPRESVMRLLNGEALPNWIMDDASLARLRTHAPAVAPSRVMPFNELERTLWTDRNRFAILPLEMLTPRYRILHIDGVHPLIQANMETYPLAFASENANFDATRITSLTLSGVTAITRQSIPPVDANGIEWLASGLAPFSTQVDFFHTSNEVSFTAECPQSTEPTLGAFCSKLAHFGVFDLIGLDIVELSGNHNNDYGYNAYLETLALYEQAGIQTLGGGATPADAQTPLILNHNGNTVAMLACNDVGPFYALASDARPGAAACGTWMQPILAELATSADVVVLTVQHIEFEEYLPNDAIRQDFRQWADWGADVVVGTHAHKPQTFEFYNTTRGERAFLHYGLGNLFFDQPFWGNSRFWMDTLLIYEGRLLTVDLFTGIIDEQARPRPMNAEEQKNFLEFMFVVNNGAQ